MTLTVLTQLAPMLEVGSGATDASLTHSLTHSLTAHSLTHSLTHSFMSSSAIDLGVPAPCLLICWEFTEVGERKLPSGSNSYHTPL